MCFKNAARYSGTAIFWKLVLSLIMVRKAIPETMPFLFSEVADEVAAFQINAVVDYMEQIREQKR